MFLFRKTLPYFIWRDEETNKYEIMNNWKINVVEVFASDMEQAVKTAALTGIENPEHYDEILEFIGYA